jgi:RNA polymerase sigma-70 factor (ECF subfamily)
LRWATTRSSIIYRLRDPHDDDAWRTFDRLYGEVMVRYARGRGLSLDDAEDVRQIVLMSLVKSMPRFDFQRDKGRFRSYLGRVVGNAIHRHRNRPHRAHEWLTAEIEAFDHGAPDEAALAIWEREWSEFHLRRAMKALARTTRPRSAEIFARLLDGATPEAVARETGHSIGAVYKLQQRMRERLRELVRNQIDEESRMLERLPAREAS